MFWNILCCDLWIIDHSANRVSCLWRYCLNWWISRHISLVTHTSSEIIDFLILTNYRIISSEKDSVVSPHPGSKYATQKFLPQKICLAIFFLTNLEMPNLELSYWVKRASKLFFERNLHWFDKYYQFVPKLIMLFKTRESKMYDFLTNGCLKTFKISLRIFSLT